MISTSSHTSIVFYIYLWQFKSKFTLVFHSSFYRWEPICSICNQKWSSLFSFPWLRLLTWIDNQRWRLLRVYLSSKCLIIFGLQCTLAHIIIITTSWVIIISIFYDTWACHIYRVNWLYIGFCYSVWVNILVIAVQNFTYSFQTAYSYLLRRRVIVMSLSCNSTFWQDITLVNNSDNLIAVIKWIIWFLIFKLMLSCSRFSIH